MLIKGRFTQRRESRRKRMSMKTKNPHAVVLGRRGGKANKGIPKPKSAENGKRGGRPKKNKRLAKEGL
jgi:hypothetical protein